MVRRPVYLVQKVNDPEPDRRRPPSETSRQTTEVYNYSRGWMMSVYDTERDRNDIVILDTQDFAGISPDFGCRYIEHGHLKPAGGHHETVK